MGLFGTAKYFLYGPTLNSSCLIVNVVLVAVVLAPLALAFYFN